MCRPACFLMATMALLVTPAVAKPLQEESMEGKFEITTQLSKHDVLVAEPFQVRIEVHGPDGAYCAFPKPTDKFGDFDVLATQDSRGVPTADGQRGWSRTMTLESLVPGEFQIPELEVVARLADQTSEDQTLRSHALPVHVTSVLAEPTEPTDFRDIQTVVDLPTPEDSWATRHRTSIIMTTSVVVLAAAGLFAFALVRRRRRPPRHAAITIAELTALVQEAAQDATDTKPMVARAGFVLRRYLVTSFPQLEATMTSREILTELDRLKCLTPSLRQQLADRFSQIDEIKFSGATLSTARGTEVCQQTLSLTQELVQHIEARIPADHLKHSTTTAGVG